MQCKFASEVAPFIAVSLGGLILCSVSIRETREALWCALTSCKVWCRGDRDVLCQTILGFMSKCASSCPGSKKQWRPMHEESTILSISLALNKNSLF